jgi:hypothetical protein
MTEKTPSMFWLPYDGLGDVRDVLDGENDLDACWYLRVQLVLRSADGMTVAVRRIEMTNWNAEA